MMQTDLRFIPPWRLAELPQNTPVLLAYSGGADSRALLDLLAKNAREDGYALTLAHVNHGIRGDEALRDRAFCVRTAEQYGLEICLADVDIPALAKESGRSLEEEAREARYEFFASLMKERSIPLLATAHHADDNLETVLFRLARGTAPRGLSGIAPTRAFGEGSRLVRPLLEATRAEILRYCAEHQLEYVTDSTNLELDCARNQIRHGVVPVMESLFAHPQHRVTALCAQMRQDEDFLSVSAARFLEQWKENGCLAQALNQAHPAIRQRALASYVTEQTGFSPEQIHLQSLLQLADDGQNGRQRELSHGWMAVIERDALRLIPTSQRESLSFQIPFSKETFTLPESGITIRVEKMEENTKIHNLSTASHIILNSFSAIMNGALYWRTRREGDTLVRGGMTRKLRKLSNEKKIPPRLRERLPLLCDDKGILWAPFVGARDGVEIREGDTLITVQIPDDFPMA